MTDLAGPSRDTGAATVSTLLTFLIADIRGYTRFTAEHGDDAAARLARSFAAVTGEIAAAHGGRVLELRGDEALAVFGSARQALWAALDLQRRFAGEAETDPSLPLHVGIGLDAGEAIPVEGGYRGAALNLAARLCSLAGPREIFASEGLTHLAQKVEGIAFLDRGEVTLKGLPSPVRVIQVAPQEAIPAQLPPLQPILVTHPTNLPDEHTVFIGREREIDQIARLLQDPHIRMVTLTGPGGTGKTRLALQAGNTLLHDFRDGVFFVNLAPLTDSSLVPGAVAQVLGVPEQTSREVLDSVADHLRARHLLLVLDNYEHLLASSTMVATLLDGCRELHVLVTSRIPLHLSREHEYPVPPLTVPDFRRVPDAENLSQYEAVALFIERARAVKPGFAVTNENAPAVAEICSRLDGLPLAIELAAARVKLFPPRALLQRLSHRLQLLTGGARDRPGRQQTLRGTLDWSYSLLSPDEQRLFARLSVFAGGCALETADAVCNLAGDLDLLEGMTSLVDKSLLREEGDEEPRFVMLETIREYAREKLAAGGEEEMVLSRHAQHYLDLGREAEAGFQGPARQPFLSRLDVELDDLRAALGWLLSRGRIEDELCLVAGLRTFWFVRGHWSEARRRLEEGLRLKPEVAAQVRAEALSALGYFAAWQGDYEPAVGFTRDALHLFEELGFLTQRAGTLTALGNVFRRHGEFPPAAEVYEEALQQYQELGDLQGVQTALAGLGAVADEQGQYGAAKDWFEKALAISRQRGDVYTVPALVNSLGIIALHEGHLEEAGDRLEEALALSRELGLTVGVAYVLPELANVDIRQGRFGRAGERLRESLLLGRDMGDKLLILAVLGGMAQLAAAAGEVERAARLGAAEARLRDVLEIPLPPEERVDRERALDGARAAAPAVWDRAWHAGEVMSLDDAIACGLGERV